MGGNQSSQSLSASLSIVTNATMDQVQSCITVSDSTNAVNITGSQNTVQGVRQNMSLVIKADCVSKLTQQNDFDSKLSDTISSKLAAQHISLLSWMSPGSESSADSINNTIKTNITTKLVQNCVTNISGTNVINVRGAGNIVRDVVQTQAISSLSSCMQGTNQSMKAVTDMSNLTNQSVTTTSKNPFAFITDGITAASEDIAATVGGIVVLIVLIVVAAEYMKHRDRKKASSAFVTTPTGVY